MSDNTNQDNIHIYLSGLNKKKVFGEENNKSDCAEKYIILVNDNLQAKQKTDMLTISNLEQRVEELEEEVEAVEKKNTYLKSILKNFHEMNKNNKELTKNNNYMYENSCSTLKYYKYRATKHLRYLEAILMGILGIFYEFYPLQYFLNVFMVLAIIVAFQESTLLNFITPKFPEKEARNKEILDEIQKTEKAQDYIHEFIDNI
jgi:hypothetical protein